MEIVYLFKKYLKKKKLNINFISRGNAWIDTGSIDNLNKALQFIANIESGQCLKIACHEKVTLNNKWISK